MVLLSPKRPAMIPSSGVLSWNNSKRARVKKWVRKYVCLFVCFKVDIQILTYLSGDALELAYQQFTTVINIHVGDFCKVAIDGSQLLNWGRSPVTLAPGCFLSSQKGSFDESKCQKTQTSSNDTGWGQESSGWTKSQSQRVSSVQSNSSEGEDTGGGIKGSAGAGNKKCQDGGKSKAVHGDVEV